jgi:hypothetical protein
MPRGLGDIPDLRLDVLQKFVTKYLEKPNLILKGLFPMAISPSSTISWESQVGSRGLTPFVPPGAPAPTTAPMGVAKHSAEAAYWKEMMTFDEEFLNNLRQEGTTSTYLSAQQRLAREMAQLVNRCERRWEWLVAKMLFDGSVAYTQRAGVKISVDYGIPSSHKVTLGADYKWSNGTSRNILGDLIDARKVIADDCGADATVAVCDSTVLKYLAQDSDIQTLLQKSAFGNGNLFEGNVNKIVNANPQIIASLLGLGQLIVYDEKYEVRAYLTAAVTGASTTAVSVDDAADFEVGGTLRFHDVSAGTYEDETITVVSPEAGTVTVGTAPSVSFKAGEDYVSMTKGFAPSNKFCLFAPRVEGMPIAELKQAPFGKDRFYGIKVDTNDTFDPEGTAIRVQSKGLPVLYQKDATYVLTVA